MNSASSSDVYRQKFGVRTIRSEDNKILLNDKPFYCHGVAKHEDSDVSLVRRHVLALIPFAYGSLLRQYSYIPKFMTHKLLPVVRNVQSLHVQAV